MIKFNCSTKDTVKLTDCVHFQGNLKKRTQKDLDALKESLENEGLMMPFAIWRHDDVNYLLDGHGRKEALVQMAMSDPSILAYEYPCLFIEAKTEDDARKALLQITSQYGKITKTGVKQFTITIPDYVAPSIQKFVIKTNNASKNVPVKETPESDKCVLRIQVDALKLPQVKEILNQFDFIKIL